MEMQVNSIDSNTSFGTKVYAAKDAYNALQNTPRNAKKKIFQHIEALKNNGADDILLLQYRKTNLNNNVIVADIYVNNPDKNEYTVPSGDWLAQEFIVDPHKSGGRQSYINIKRLYNKLLEHIKYFNTQANKEASDSYLKTFIEL